MEERRGKWQQIIKEQRASGQSISAFCRERGISESSLAYWRSKLRCEKGGAEKFVRVDSTPELVELELTGGTKLRVKKDDLKAVLEALCER